MSSDFSGMACPRISSDGLGHAGDLGIGERVSFTDVDRACDRFLRARDHGYRIAAEDRDARKAVAAPYFNPKAPTK